MRHQPVIPGVTLGIDGCRGGWVAVRWDGRNATVSLHGDILGLAADHAGISRALIDMPIGLPEEQPRRCDTLARRRLGPRRASVFPVPCRDAVYAASYSAACAINRDRIGRALSKQSWNICPRIAEVDHYLRSAPSLPLIEAHPELAFAAFAGAPLSDPKRRPAGRAARTALLAHRFAGTPSLLAQALDTHHGQVAADDVLDALALALAAAGALVWLPDPPDHDAAGLPMAIAFPGAD